MSKFDDIQEAVLGKPIEVNPGNTVALLALILRYLGTAGSFLVAVIGFIGQRDLAGLFQFLQGETILPALAALATLAFMAWGAVRLVLNKRKLVVAADAAPNTVAVVVKPTA